MKILNWMQRKLHPATDYSRVSPNKSPKAFAENTGELTDAAPTPAPDAEAPLLQYALECTILTIGTLGHTLLLPHFSEEEPGAEQPQLERPAPPMPDSGPLAQTLPLPESDLHMIKFASDAAGAAEEKTMAEEPLMKGGGEKKERTTLAELFAADPASPAKCSLALKITVDEDKKKNKLNSLQSPASAKWLHRMITRMVKNKIHPEVAAPPGKKGGKGVEPLLHGVHGGRGDDRSSLITIS